MNEENHLKLIHTLVRGQGIELVIEDAETGARAEVIGTVTQVIDAGQMNLVKRAYIRGRACELPATERLTMSRSNGALSANPNTAGESM